MPRPAKRLSRRQPRMNSSEVPPGSSYLVLDRPIVDATGSVVSSLAPKCAHAGTHGQWVVAWRGRFLPFVHANNLQKDIWLHDAGSEAEQTERLKLLRWFCHECGTVQEP